MIKKRYNVAIFEPSLIVYEGVCNILHKADYHVNVYRISDIDELVIVLDEKEIDIVVLNAALIQNRIKDFRRNKKNVPSLKWIACVTSLIDESLISLYDNSFTLYDSQDYICELFSKLASGNKTKRVSLEQSQLSDRERDVLVQLIHGMSNKEIAETLNISIHTVITHRKNITVKTGIKSQSGLTIYAISQKIVSLDELTS